MQLSTNQNVTPATLPLDLLAISKSPLGITLEKHFDSDSYYPQYLAFARVGEPSVRAAVYELRKLFPGAETDGYKRFVGHLVARVMRRHGHTIVKKGSVHGGYFNTGAVWDAEPIAIVAGTATTATAA